MLYFLNKYFASIGVLIGLLNTLFLYKRIYKIRQNNNENEIDFELNNFIKWYGICFTVPYLLIQIFQILGKYNSIFFLFLLDFNNPFFVLSFISMILFWGLLLYLVFSKNGSEIMIKYHKAFGNLPANKNILKLFYCLTVLVGLLVLLFGNKISGGAITYFYENVFNN